MGSTLNLRQVLFPSLHHHHHPADTYSSPNSLHPIYIFNAKWKNGNFLKKPKRFRFPQPGPAAAAATSSFKTAPNLPARRLFLFNLYVLSPPPPPPPSLPLNPTSYAPLPLLLSSMEFDLDNPLTPCPETLASLFLVEPDHMPREKYVQRLKEKGCFDVAVRRELTSSISHLSSGLDPLSSYLAVNYLDRFLSCQSLPHLSPWVLRLLAVCCVSLAAKMRNPGFSLAHFRGNGGFIHDSRTIQRMEVLILGALKWRMRSVTPFSFVAFFTSLFKLEDPPLRQALNARATEIIFKSQNDIELMDFRPSVIAASALLSASHELFPLQFSCFRTAILNCPYVNKDDLLECYSAMEDVAMEGYESVYDMISRSDTPINVLDQSFSNSEDGDEKANGGSSGAISTSTITRTTLRLRSERLLKRRKVSDHCCDLSHSFQLSQFQQCADAGN